MLMLQHKNVCTKFLDHIFELLSCFPFDVMKYHMFLHLASSFGSHRMLIVDSA